MEDTKVDSSSTSGGGGEPPKPPPNPKKQDGEGQPPIQANLEPMSEVLQTLRILSRGVSLKRSSAGLTTSTPMCSPQARAVARCLSCNREVTQLPPRERAPPRSREQVLENIRQLEREGQQLPAWLEAYVAGDSLQAARLLHAAYGAVVRSGRWRWGGGERAAGVSSSGPGRNAPSTSTSVATGSSGVASSSSVEVAAASSTTDEAVQQLQPPTPHGDDSKDGNDKDDSKDEDKDQY